MIRILLIAGSGIFLLLGALHGFYTLVDLSRPRYFAPPDAELREAMQRSSIRFHPEINLWRAWLGFNLSHSLGLIMFGGFYLQMGIFSWLAFTIAPEFQAAAILISAVYLVLSLKFWFSKPALGSGIALLCFIAATALSYV